MERSEFSIRSCESVEWSWKADGSEEGPEIVIMIVLNGMNRDEKEVTRLVYGIIRMLTGRDRNIRAKAHTNRKHEVKKVLPITICIN